MGRSGLQRRALAVCPLVFCLGSVSSLFLHVAEREQRCFIQEIPEKTKLVGDFWTRLFDEQKDEYLPAPGDLFVSVTATDPNNQLILSQQEGSNGTFSFTSSDSGEHRLCLQPNSSQPSQSARRVLAIHMDVRSAGRTDSNTRIQSLNGLKKLQLRVRQLLDHVQHIQKELDYLRRLEEDFYNLNYNTNMCIFWWPIIRAVYVVVFVVSFTSAW
ncbi:transmembrane emp24 domain-containing protein 9 [Nematolebias whitei]|uniref:transmembrane emp24 domain-containing protein 9 n=1 Tax=Nematolebias whitei TaxID=451745 RepID=UPI00189AFB53|nr:transmembrane emp24 domain-containing protein 9 [Nematolebias whitei]